MIHKRENNYRMKHRCEKWDYSLPGTYMITITLANRSKPILGELSNCEMLKKRKELHAEYDFDPDIIIAKTNDTNIKLTKLGQYIYDQWYDLYHRYSNIVILNCCVMPDHFHGIIWVMKPSEFHLGEIIRKFKSATTNYYRQITKNTDHLWADGYVDSILRTPLALKRAKEYIENNPRRLALKTIIPNLFNSITEIKIKQLFLSAPDFIAEFTGIGNKFLLNKPFFYQVQCSRKDFVYERTEKGEVIENVFPRYKSEIFCDKMSVMLEAGYNGAVIVSPCISDGEMALTREASNRGFPLIILRKMGFSKVFKPSGEFFDLCARGKLLMLAPKAWEFSYKKEGITREKALILNRLASLISKNSEIKYENKNIQIDDNICIEACKGRIKLIR